MTQPVSPHAYLRVFELNPDGAEILSELVAKFGRNPYVRGGHDAERQTAFNAGAFEVVQHILRRINRAQGADDEPQEDPHPDERGAGG